MNDIQNNSYPLPIVIEKDGDNERAYDIYSRLMKDRIIFLGTPINMAVANAVEAQLLLLENQDPDKEIYMYINSPGGDVMAGLGIYDTMMYVKPDITTVCTGHAMSMGCFLLAGGTPGKRYSLPHARIMMHSVQASFRGSAPDISIQFEEIMKLQSELWGLFSDNTGQSIEIVKAEFERERFMSPDEAIKFGIIDGIHKHSIRSNDE